MSKSLPIYGYVYLESGDIIFSKFDENNMITSENQFVGAWSYFGPGIINGWAISWMGCKSNSYVMHQRQFLIDSYRTQPFSYYALQYESLNYPLTDADWEQCVVVSSGLGIVGLFYAATEYPTFFRYTIPNNYYVWAQSNACTATEHLCSIVSPVVPDPDYGIYNSAVYIGEVYVNTVNGSVVVAQINYSSQRIEINNQNGYLQQQLEQLLVAHVHSGASNMPSKIALDTKVTINVGIVTNSTALSFSYPTGFSTTNYNSVPKVYLNGNILPPSSYNIDGLIIYLPNSLPASSSLQITYELTPGKAFYITDNLSSDPSNITSLINPTGSSSLNYSIVYYVTDGTYVTNSDGSTTINVFKWDSSDYSQIQLYLNGDILDDSTYILNGALGTLQFIGPIIPSIVSYSEYQVSILFVTPSFQVEGVLPISKIASINAASFISGTVPNSRIAGLDHLGFFRLNEKAQIIPYKLLLDSGDHIHFYPEINSPIQLIDYIYHASTVDNIKLTSNESITPSRTIISTANGLYATTASSLDFADIVSIPWSTDNGIADEFDENYYGNFEVLVSGSGSASVDPQFFWLLCRSENQYQNSLYLCTDFGFTYEKIFLPVNSTNNFVTVNDFIFTLNIQIITSGQIFQTQTLDVTYIYYLATTDGLYTATLTTSENPTVPAWINPNKNTTNYPTGSINAISEAVNVAVNSSTNDSGTTTSYIITRNLYAACDNGLFLYSGGNGTLFNSNSNYYNQDSSIFNFVKWIGNDQGSSNTPANIVWADSYGVYITLSAQLITTTTSDGTNSSTTQVFSEPLTQNTTSFVGQYGIANSIYCASTININLNSTISNIDGINLVNNALILVKNQTVNTENGIYIWSSLTQLLSNINAPNPSYILVQNGNSQAQTEWINLTTTDGSIQYGLWFANIISLTEGDYVVSVTKDQSSGPGSNLSLINGQSGVNLYPDSYFVATTQYIFRVLANNNTPNVIPIIVSIPWLQINANGSSTNIYGDITEIQHYASSADPENGLLVVFTENGIFESTGFIFSSKPTPVYQRFTNAFSSIEAPQASVYDDYTLAEYNGELVTVSPVTTNTTIPDGTYLNNPIYYSGLSQSPNYSIPATLNATILNGIVTDLSIYDAGGGYYTNIINGFILISGIKILFNATTKGLFLADSNSQSFTYSNGEIFPSSLLYEVDYTNFYIQPWAGNPLVIIQINNQSTNLVFTYNASTGLIGLNSNQPSITLQEKNSITVSLSNPGQYISNAGDTPHLEVFNITATDANYTTILSGTYDPTTANGNSLLPLASFNNQQWNSNINLVKIAGLRPSTVGGTILVQYSEIIQVYVDMDAEKVYILSVPTNLQLTQGSYVYIARLTPDVLGIQDKITLAKSNLTYNLDSISHSNVYTLNNSLLAKIPSLYTYPVYSGEILTGVNRGLQNTISIQSLSSFDPSATFTGYSFGVSPSSSDVPASPTFINLILDLQYGDNPIFATDQGIWQYTRTSGTWSKLDSIGGSQEIFFANLPFTDSTGTPYTFAGTNLGLFYEVNGAYVINPLFTDPMLSLSMGVWLSSSTGSSQRYEAYGQNNNLSFVLRTTNTTNGSSNFISDFFTGHNIYSIYYDTFKRYDENNNETDHPALYVGTDIGLYGFTTDYLAGWSPETFGNGHSLLVRREMFGANAIRNSNILNPSFPGPLSKIFKVIPLAPPAGSNVTWLAVCSSNGVYVVINWKQCDVGDINGLTFFPQNTGKYNKTIGNQCYVLIPKSGSTSTYFVGTDNGVFKSIDRCYSWNPASKFGNKVLSVNDLKSFYNNNIYYLVAATNVGLYVSTDDGDTWTAIQSFNDPNIQINSHPTNGIFLNENPQQVFSTQVSGTIGKAFIYLDPTNLEGSTTVSANITNLQTSISTTSTTSIVLNPFSFPGSYGFTFTNTPIFSSSNYAIGIVTDGSQYASQVNWNLSTLDNPFAFGYAKTSGAVITNKDFFFLIDENTSGQVTEIIEPVGFYNTSYSVGFASGTFSGASISSSGFLYSNVGIICNIVLDTSKSFEINDSGILNAINSQGMSTSFDYVKQAIINSLVPNGVSTNNLYTRLSNGFGTSKFLAAIYGFDNTISDLLTTSGATGTNDCLTYSSSVDSGYTNTPSDLQNAIIYVSNSGRSSRLYDAMLYNARLQFPAVIQSFYEDFPNLIDSNFINTQSIIEQYTNNYEFYLQCNLVFSSSNTYSIIYENSGQNFIWFPSDYNYNLIVYSNGSSSVANNFNPSTGTLKEFSGLTPLYFLLSKDWNFDASINGISTSYESLVSSPEGFSLALIQYANSFKPLIIVATDGNDNSQAQPSDVNEALKVAWTGSGTQVLVVEPSSSGNQNDLRDMISDTNSKIFEYSSYPESQLDSILFTNDNLDLFTSSWSRTYDFDSAVYISRIYASYNEPGNSSVSITFSWSNDRINFSPQIPIPNSTNYCLNQNVIAIIYTIEFTEDYDNGRILPFVNQLYHVQVLPFQQTYLSYPQTVNGQIFETLAMASFLNNETTLITPIIGRTASIDTTYYETTHLNRNGALSNRQTSYRITQPYNVTGLSLFPSSVATNSSTGITTYTYTQFYIIDSNDKIYSWSSPTDTFILYANGNPVAPSGYTQYGASGQIGFASPQNYQLPNGNLAYTIYSCEIDYGTKSETIIGEPTTTANFKTYYLINGRFPTDAYIVVLINQEIFRGSYTLSPYDGTVTFATTRDATDYVTVFIKFADTFRVGLQIQSYTNNNLSLQNFNFTYTALDDLPTYTESFNYSRPTLTGGPFISPIFPNINDLLSVNYIYYDADSTPENGTSIQWWRQRTGIEYAIFNPSYALNVIGSSFIGIQTFNVYSQNQSVPFIISATVNSIGTTATIISAYILDRGVNFIGTSTSIIGISTNSYGYCISNIGAALTAFTLTPSFSPGYATSNYFVRINPNSPIGYSTSIFAYPSNVYFSNLPNYDSLSNERSIDVGNRTLFDARDTVFVTVTPNNGFATGNTYTSGYIIMNNSYTASISNLNILTGFSSFNGISTTLCVHSNSNQIASWYYNSNNPIGYAATQYSNSNYSYNIVSWYKLQTGGPILLSNVGVLNSNLINLNDQIYCAVTPGFLLANGLVGYGNTVNSNVYNVSS